MANKITYNNKAPMQDDPEIPVENKATAEDFNEIKEVVNNNADELNTANENIKKLQNGQGTSNTEITNLKNKVQALENDNATNKANISTLQEDNNTNKNNITNLQNNKVDKEEGKGLSTNDFTNEEKEKLAGLNNYDDTEIIDLLPKVSNEGESITLENTARAKFTKFRIEGNSKQETRSGKNLINSFYNHSAGYTMTNKGVTFTLLEDGKIRVNGTATGGRAAFTFFIPDTTVKAGNYILSRGSEKVQVEAKIGDTYYRVAGSSSNVSIVEAQKIFYVALIVNEGLTVNNEVVYAQLEDGTVATEYEQYGTMPSEEFSSEIRNVGDNGNLYDKDNPNILDTPIDTSGLGGNVKNTYKTVWIPCKPNTTYTVSKKYDATKNRFALAYTSEEPNYSQQVEGYVSNMYTNVMTITTNSTAKYLIAYVWIAGGSNTYQEMLDSIKIEKGTQATLDNGHGLGSMEIIICNKNILNQDLELFQGNYDNNGNVITNPDRRIDKYIFLAKGNYILWSTINNWINVLIYDKNKKLLSIKNSNTNKEIAFTLDEDGYIRFGFNPTVESLKVFQLERNTEKITSEEHKQQIIIFPFKQGQKLMQGDCLADDGIHHKRKQTVLDGTENWVTLTAQKGDNTSYFYCTKTDMKKASLIVCNQFINRAGWSTDVEGIESIINNTLRLRINTSRASTVSELKAWLATQKEKETPVVIEYELVQEEVETYTEVQKEAYEQIKNAISYKGQTNIFSTNEIKPIFEVEALADIGLLLNNMQAQILAGGE